MSGSNFPHSSYIILHALLVVVYIFVLTTGGKDTLKQTLPFMQTEILDL